MKRVFLWAAILLTLLAPWSVVLGQQARQLPDGVTTTTQPITLGPRDTLAGVGASSELRYAGPGPWAVIVDGDPYIYHAWIRDLTITGGGVLWKDIDQTSGMERVAVYGAPLDGVRIEARGERLALRDVAARENGRHGIVVASSVPNNGVLLDRCNAQHNWGVGVLLETTSRDADQVGTILRDCVVQGNLRADLDRDGAVGLSDLSLAVALDTPARVRVLGRYGERLPADVWIHGWVGRARIESCWIESPGRVGLRVESRSFGRFAELKVYPGRLTVTGATWIAQARIAAELVEAHDARIDELIVSGASKVRWTRWPPGGARRDLAATQLEELPEQIEPVVKP